MVFFPYAARSTWTYQHNLKILDFLWCTFATFNSLFPKFVKDVTYIGFTCNMFLETVLKFVLKISVINTLLIDLCDLCYLHLLLITFKKGKKSSIFILHSTCVLFFKSTNLMFRKQTIFLLDSSKKNLCTYLHSLDP